MTGPIVTCAFISPRKGMSDIKGISIGRKGSILGGDDTLGKAVR